MARSFSGTYTALVTPFQDDLSIDWKAYEHLLEAQIAGGITGLVPCGTTGESPTLDHGEQLALVRRTVEVTKGRSIVIAGTGSSSTQSTIAMSQAAERAGVDAVMVVVPYYNKPTQAGMIAHFVAVAASVKCPVVVYNIPARTGVDLQADTLAAIADKAPNVTVTKEATGNVLRAQEIARLMGDRMTVLSGDDSLTIAMVAVGGKGVISVASNVYPADVTKATKLALDGRFEEARKAHQALLPFYESMFIESNPSPVKSAMQQKSVMKDLVRSPLVRISESAKAKVGAVMKAYESR